jgi:hypothetical protein
MTQKQSTLKQVFNAWVKVQKKKLEVFGLDSKLRDVANKTDPGTELIEHEDAIYRVSVTSRWNGSHEYSIEKIADISEVKKLQK